MSNLDRREFMLLSAAVPAMLAAVGSGNATAASTSGMYICMHGATSSGFDFRAMMEGWSKAGITAAEPDLPIARTFEDANGPGSARRLMDDLGIRAVSSSNQLYLEESGPRRLQALEDLKWKLELAESLGADRLVVPTVASGTYSMADYDQVYENLYEAAEIARPHNIALMLEFIRFSTLINSVRTALHVVRTVDHPNLKFMIDLYHFWAGMSKFEDLDLINEGEVHHVHFEDTPALPHLEVAELKDRAYPGEGVAPLQSILNKLAEKGYSRALSLELFDPVVQNTDPEVVARKGIETMTPFMNG
ncbi:MAG: sugar phosphate isomerase/epimerase family protein [Porticoccaceae bacterium]